MNKKFVTLILILLGMAFKSSVYAVELDEFGAVEIHGFISQGYMMSDDNNFYASTEHGGTSQFNEVGLNFKSNVSDRLMVGIQFFTRDLGRLGNNEVTIDYAFADYSLTSWANLRAGKVKLPFGLYNMERDVDMLRTFVFLPQSFYNEGWRDSANAMNGAGLYGYIPAGLAGTFVYNVYGGNTSVDNDSGVVRLFENAMPTEMGMDVIGTDVNYTTSWTLAWESIFGVEGLRIVGGMWDVDLDFNIEHNNGKVSFWDTDAETGATINPYTIIAAGGITDLAAQESIINTALANGTYTAERSNGFMHVRNLTSSLSLEYAMDDLVLAAEIMQNDLTFEFDLFPGGVEAYRTLGWYASLTYRVTDWLELGTCYGEYYANKNDKKGKKIEDWGGSQAPRPWQKDLTFATRFDLSSSWVFKLEVHSIDGATLLFRDENKSDANGFPIYEKNWVLAAAKLSYSF